MDEVFGAVLAAGLGTRLRPLTDRLPKPLVPVAGRPLAEYALDALATLRPRAVGINAFHLGHLLPAAFAHRREQIHYIHETELQGTGGGLRGIAAALPRGTIAVVNGDALFDFDLAPLLAQHRRRGAMATLVLRPARAEEPFGLVGVDPDGRLQQIAEVAGLNPDPTALRWGVFTGVQLVEPELLDALPPAGACDVLRTAYARRMREGAPVLGTFVDAGCTWLDVGNLERYLAANAAVVRHPTWLASPRRSAGGARIDPTAEVSPSARVEGDCLIGAGATIGAGARVGVGCVIDRGARVAAGADLERCVLWPGACAEGRRRDEVLPGEAQPSS